jgi:hypothetical protein
MCSNAYHETTFTTLHVSRSICQSANCVKTCPDGETGVEKNNLLHVFLWSDSYRLIDDSTTPPHIDPGRNNRTARSVCADVTPRANTVVYDMLVIVLARFCPLLEILSLPNIERTV